MKQDPAVAYFYSARAHRSRGALWPSFAPALIQVHTNSLENFWSLMKRNLAGTYVAVEPFHLDRYLDEQCFRFNNRIGHTAASRFDKMVTQIIGRRLTYAELTGKDAKAQAF